jgi:hypothetical protein
MKQWRNDKRNGVLSALAVPGRWAKAAAVAVGIVAVAALLTAGAGPAGAASISSAAPHGEVTAVPRGEVTARSSGVHLTPTQAQRLRSALASNPGLTRAEALRIIGRPAAGAVTPDGSGYADVGMACGVAVVQGNPQGYWYASARFNTAIVGTASLGVGTVSTNAVLGADSIPFGVSGATTTHENWDLGLLDPIGWGATGTTFSGWALTTGGWWCEWSGEDPWTGGIA